jgi:hypothetical protein
MRTKQDKQTKTNKQTNKTDKQTSKQNKQNKQIDKQKQTCRYAEPTSASGKQWTEGAAATVRLSVVDRITEAMVAESTTFTSYAKTPVTVGVPTGLPMEAEIVAPSGRIPLAKLDTTQSKTKKTMPLCHLKE